MSPKDRTYRKTLITIYERINDAERRKNLTRLDDEILLRDKSTRERLITDLSSHGYRVKRTLKGEWQIRW